MADLETQIMNIPTPKRTDVAHTVAEGQAYRLGHRDARHAAAELAAAELASADAEVNRAAIAELVAGLNGCVSAAEKAFADGIDDADAVALYLLFTQADKAARALITKYGD